MVRARLTRHEAILGQRQPEIFVIISEAALHQAVGGTEIMRAQFAALAEAGAHSPTLTIQILPFSSGAHAACSSGSLAILRFPGTPSLGIVQLAGPSGGISLHSQTDVAHYARVFAQLKISALTPAQSVALLRHMANN
jgi:hypothetical protein